MEKYIGVKMIQAEPMTRGEYNDFRGWTIPADENPDDDGYVVKYSDDYVSWSPKAVFEEAYRKTDGLSFGLAVEALKKRFRVCRKGWNGKGMYIELNQGIDYSFSIIEPFFVIKNVKNSFNTWVPSISDILAEDWMIIE